MESLATFQCKSVFPACIVPFLPLDPVLKAELGGGKPDWTEHCEKDRIPKKKNKKGNIKYLYARYLVNKLQN